MRTKEDIDTKIVTLYMNVEEANEDIDSEIEIPVEVPEYMNTKDVLDIFVKTVSVWARKEKKPVTEELKVIVNAIIEDRKELIAEAYYPKNKIEKMYINGIWGIMGIKEV